MKKCKEESDDDELSSCELEELAQIESSVAEHSTSTATKHIEKVTEETGESSSSCPETCPDMGVNLQCPICLEHFPIKTVEEHAAQCEVSHPSLYQILPEFDGDSDEEDDNDAKKKEFTEISQPSCVLKDKVMNLAVTLFDLEEERVRITVCRKQVWDDYKRARYYSPEKKIKVTFSGESAIDDGGPQREFFSGIVNIFSLIVQHQKEVRSNKN